MVIILCFHWYCGNYINNQFQMKKGLWNKCSWIHFQIFSQCCKNGRFVEQDVKMLVFYYNKKIESTNLIIIEIHILYGGLEIKKYLFTHLQCNRHETLIESMEDHFLSSLLHWYFPAQAQLDSSKVKPSIGLIWATSSLFLLYLHKVSGITTL